MLSRHPSVTRASIRNQRASAPPASIPPGISFLNSGAQGRIRTSVARKERQIYSLLPLTTRPPVHPPSTRHPPGLFVKHPVVPERHLPLPPFAVSPRRKHYLQRNIPTGQQGDIRKKARSNLSAHTLWPGRFFSRRRLDRAEKCLVEYLPVEKPCAASASLSDSSRKPFSSSLELAKGIEPPTL